MTRRWLAAAAVAALAITAPASAAGHANVGAAARPAIVAYSFPEQCVVLPVERKSFDVARALLARLGCRSRRSVRTSTLPKNEVIAVVGGERTYAFGHVVTLIVSSGPAT